MNTIRVMVVDDHPMWGKGVVESLAGLPDILPIAQALDLDEAVEVALRLRPDVILCDLMFDDKPTGFDLPALLAARGIAGCRVVFLSQFSNSVLEKRAREAGGHGLLPKTITDADLHEAIVTVFGGELLEQVGNDPVEIEPGSQTRPPSPREIEILRSIAAGMSGSEIAHQLGIGARTVEEHMARLFDRYDVHSRAQLLLLAERNDWLRDKSARALAGFHAIRPSDQ